MTGPLLLETPEGRNGMKWCLVSASPPKMAHSLWAPPSPSRQTVDTVFLFSSSSCSAFSIFKENSCLAEGAQLQSSLAAQRAQQGAIGPRNPFPGKVAGWWPHFPTALLPVAGAWLGASECKSLHLARKLVSTPNSQTCVTAKPRPLLSKAVAVVIFWQLGHLGQAWFFI